MFKCPVCRRYHRVNDNYDNSDIECTDNKTAQVKEFQDMPSNPANQTEPLMDRFNQKQDVYRNAGVKAEFFSHMSEIKKKGIKNY